MIPSLSRAKYEKRLPSLFAAESGLRPLRVMADAELVDQLDPSEWSPQTILSGLLTHDSIELFRFADDGPPPDAPTAESDWLEGVPIGWVTAEPFDNPAMKGLATHSLVWSDAKTVTNAAIGGNVVEVATLDNSSPVYRELGGEEACRRRTADAVAGGAARELKADLFVTERPYLLGSRGTMFGSVTTCSVADALALVSLYLRSRGEHFIARGPRTGNLRFNRGLFYWVGARELLPEGWRWFTACVTHAQQQADDELTYLGGAAFQRITRALQIRDDLHRAINRPQDNDVADDALMALDTCLIYLMGALDAVARVANRVIGSPMEPHQVGWQAPKWIAKVQQSAPALARVVNVSSDGADSLTILRSLRNSIHGEGLTALAIGSGRQRDATLVALPRSDAKRILEAVDRLGERAAWGVSERLPGRLHAEPAPLLESLLPHVIRLLNDLMRETPVETLLPPGTALSSSPPEGEDSPFRQPYRQSIRWQLGF
jgi:hypothetical protein